MMWSSGNIAVRPSDCASSPAHNDGELLQDRVGQDAPAKKGIKAAQAARVAVFHAQMSSGVAPVSSLTFSTFAAGT